MPDLLTTLLSIRTIAGAEKFETLKPMREIFGLAGQCLDLARAAAPEQAAATLPKKQLLIVQVPNLDCPSQQGLEAGIRKRLDACGLSHEILILDGDTRLHLLGEDACESWETSPPDTDPDAARDAAQELV